MLLKKNEISVLGSKQIFQNPLKAKKNFFIFKKNVELDIPLM